MIAIAHVEQLARRVLKAAAVQIEGQPAAQKIDRRYVTELFVRIRDELLSEAQQTEDRRAGELADALVLTICLVTASHRPGAHLSPEFLTRLHSLIADTLDEGSSFQDRRHCQEEERRE